MKILMTNHRMESAGGSEWFVVEIATALRSAGHEVAVFTTVAGEMAGKLAAAGIPVIGNPGECPFVPDLLHGQHHLETMAALAAWPGVPAVYFIHGATPWEEHPPTHPRIRRYLATSPRFAWWVARECGVPESVLIFVRNFFDPSRFPVLRPASSATRRALVFHNTMAPDGEAVAALDEACRRTGYTLERAGKAMGNMIADPGKVLPEYDLVFAAGRSAIEAMACGCGVIPVTARQSADRIHPGNYAEMVERNFTAETNAPPMDAEEVANQIRALRAEETAEIARRVREEATLGATITHLLSVYADVLADPAETDPVAESVALSCYLTGLAARVKDADEARARLVDEKDRAVSRAGKWKIRAEKFSRTLRALETAANRAPWWIRRWWRRARRANF